MLDVTTKGCEINNSLIGIFKKQVIKDPGKNAIIYGEKSISYKQLDEMSDNVAYTLYYNNIKKNDIVAVAMENNESMIISILGVLKVGAVYMPVDLQYPADRIKYMIEDSKAAFLLTVKPKSNCWFEGCNTLNMNDIMQMEETMDINIECEESHPVCVIYTSGSTGIPKGVLVNQKGLVNYVLWRIDKYDISSNDKILQLLSPSFDGYGSNLYTCLLSGSTLVLYDKKNDYEFIGDQIYENKITHFSVVPTIYNEILRFSKTKQLTTIKSVVLGGESIPHQLIEKTFDMLPHIKIYNEYGLTETSIAVTTEHIKNLCDTNLIGSPITGNIVRLMDEKGNCSDEVKDGELLISGLCLSYGYLNDVQLSKEKFLQLKNEVFFKTGDRAKITDKGFVYCGRMDSQIKKDGHRIEPNEVVTLLLEHSHVRDARVIVCHNALNKVILSAFIVCRNLKNEINFREYLSKLLPYYMIPDVFVKLEQIPILPNGKTDNASLQAIYEKSFTGKNRVQPDNKTEQHLIQIWKEILEQDSVYTDISFFEQGGNSILLMQVHKRLEDLYPYITTILDLFSYPSIVELAQYINKHLNEEMSREELFEENS